MPQDWKEDLARQTGYKPPSKPTGGQRPVARGENDKENFFEMKNGKKVIREALLTSNADEWASQFVSPEPPKRKGEKNPPLTKSQIRRFYNEVKMIERQLDGGILSFEEALPLIKMIKSKVAYACPDGGKRKIPREFKDYLEKMVNSIETEADFKAFALTFEAVVGFFYGKNPRDE